ncbi:F0F1 ATP synthase subunit alpha [Athalassotoga saccharophila]|uniref:F0F1 ATP synthase subunit alpha n=1 Tax=Athalassotoga saccharophila TaxID=1441386 RepID=UPI0013797B21|nr:F0F1 ATP synthase subunit alpha [Athalassotoga saccharophila]BBJ27841.1 ATP synthase subunit alpha [Athalassotoga saccharophila]
MRINPDEISKVLLEKIENFERIPNLKEVGHVVQMGDGIAHVYGLENAMYGELVRFDKGQMGMIMSLEIDSVGVVVLGEYKNIKEGDLVERTGRVVEVPVGDELIGRVVDPLGKPLDGGPAITSKKTMPIERKAVGIIERQPVKVPLHTGIKAIDAMIPIGRGQRELIIGDRQTGKTAIAIDTIINQKNQGVICVYVAIGQKNSEVARTIEKLRKTGAMNYTTVVVANASDPAALRYISPYAGATMAEEWMFSGKDTLVVYDDLSKHAASYRELALLLRRPPGREAYPGDIFYTHSRLLERSARLSDELGGGSMTALPIIETQANDVSAYIPTNVISITDGQIYLESSLFYGGFRPAINVGLSVSRVGGSAQTKAIKKIAGNLRIMLAQYRELETFAQFSTELDPSTQSQIKRGQHLMELLKQEQFATMPFEEEAVSIYAGVRGYIDDLPLGEVKRFEKGMIEKMKKETKILDKIREKKDIDAETEEELKRFIEEFKKKFGGR